MYVAKARSRLQWRSLSIPAKVEKGKYWCPSPCGTIAAKDELICLRIEREEGNEEKLLLSPLSPSFSLSPSLFIICSLSPYVFDVIESLVFAEAIVPSPDNLELLSYREKLIFPSAGAIPREREWREKTKVMKVYSGGSDRKWTRLVSFSRMCAPSINDGFIGRCLSSN